MDRNETLVKRLKALANEVDDDDVREATEALTALQARVLELEDACDAYEKEYQAWATSRPEVEPNPADYDCCDEHEAAFLRGDDCPVCSVEVDDDEVDAYCQELSWFRGCEDFELDDFLIEINKDRAKAVDLITRLHAQTRELEDSLHYANGTSDLAMKHRDIAERQLADLRKEIYECENNPDFCGHSFPPSTTTEEEL